MPDLVEQFRREGARGFENGKLAGIKKASAAFCREVHKACELCRSRPNGPYCTNCSSIEEAAMIRLEEERPR